MVVRKTEQPTFAHAKLAVRFYTVFIYHHIRCSYLSIILHIAQHRVLYGSRPNPYHDVQSL